jgi:hypothetical protein
MPDGLQAVITITASAEVTKAADIQQDKGDEPTEITDEGHE